MLVFSIKLYFVEVRTLLHEDGLGVCLPKLDAAGYSKATETPFENG